MLAASAIVSFPPHSTRATAQYQKRVSPSQQHLGFNLAEGRQIQFLSSQRVPRRGLRLESDHLAHTYTEVRTQEYAMAEPAVTVAYSNTIR